MSAEVSAEVTQNEPDKKRKRYQRGRWSQAQVQSLRDGADQDGAPRSWEEVAAITKLTPNYLRAMYACGSAYKLPADVTIIDPRDFEPKLADLMDDAAVQAWQGDPRCVCGCGTTTRREVGTKARVPRGAHRLWHAGHYSRMEWVKEFHAQRNRAPEFRKANSERQRAESILTGVLAEIIDEWLAADPERTVDELAAAAYMAVSHVRAIRGGGHKRVKLFTHARLLAAMDEPMPSKVAAAYRQWMRRRGLAPKKIKVHA